MSESSENVCIVCFKTVKIFSIGCCDHNVCFECSTRMRVLCRQNECPICRQQMQTVIFTRDVKPFATIKDSCRWFDKKYSIGFASQRIQDAFYDLLEHSCSKCRNKVFRTFQDLSDHMKRAHDLHYCDLCVENLKILTSERRCYTRAELTQHRKKGDTDDRSHRGHPLCEFCDTRYMDNDDLYRHVRRDHLYCHFCDADGLHMYYSSYDYLRDHFRQEHFLCEEGGCVDEKFTPVFRTEIDLRAHRASEHGRLLGKVAAKQARTLEVEFTLKPRARPNDPKRKGRGQVPENSEQREEEPIAEVRREPTPPLTASDFPTLGVTGGPSSVPLTNIAPPRVANAYTIRAVGRKGPQYDQHFPGLPGDLAPAPAPAPSTSTSVRLNFNSSMNSVRKPGSAPASKPNVSIKVTSHGRNIQVTQDAFPVLKSNKDTSATNNLHWKVSKTAQASSSSSSSSSTWTGSSKKTPAPAPLAATQPPPKTKEEDFPSLNSKFSSLNVQNEPLKANFVNLKSNLAKSNVKKTTSVTIPLERSLPEPEIVQPKSKTKKKKRGGSEDTVRKKDDKPAEEEPSQVNAKPATVAAAAESSALNWDDAKPLPTAADWFGGNKTDAALTLLREEGPADTEINDVVESVLHYSRLMSNKSRKPPPGFEPVNGFKPPPGFDSVQQPVSNGTFSSPFSIPSPVSYLTPPDFARRNQELVTKVNEILLGQDALEEFRYKSAAFRNGEISGNDYFQHCLLAMGSLGVAEVLPELLVLLPDIGKQQQLLTVLEKAGTVPLTGKRRLESCAECRQVVFAYEMKTHLASHVVNNNADYS